MPQDPAPERDQRGRVTRTGAQITQGRTAARETRKAGESDRMQAGYDVYTASTGRKVDTGITGGESRSAYKKWATSDEGKAAWKNRERPKPTNTSGRTAQDAGDALAKADKE